MLSSHSAIGVGENAETTDFVQSNGKLLFNGFGVPAERKLSRLKTSQGIKPSNSHFTSKLPLMQTFDQNVHYNALVNAEEEEKLLDSNRHYKDSFLNNIAAAVSGDSMSISDDGATTMATHQINMRMLKNK